MRTLLIQCPECNSQVSDKAKACPVCGYPVSEQISPEPKEQKPKRQRRHMKLPNGFGRISKVSTGNRRNPYRVMVSVGKTENGKPIGKLLKPKAYFRTYQEAYAALIEYNKNPYDLDTDITVEELYSEWSEKYFKETSDSNAEMVRAVWQYATSVYKMRVKDLRVRHIKGVMENGYRIETRGANKGEKIYPTTTIKIRIKIVFSKMLDYAVENEIVDKNYAREFQFSRKGDFTENANNKESHIAFTEEELQILWSHVNDNNCIEWILIECYTGFRPGEMLGIKLEDVNLEKRTIIGGGKTASGYRREIPIHSRVFQLVEKNITAAKTAGLDTLIVDQTYEHSKVTKVSYNRYKYLFDCLIKELKLNPNHNPHDCRKTFATRLTKAGANQWSVKKMLGHKISDITEGVYVSRDVEWLRSELEKMK